MFDDWDWLLGMLPNKLTGGDTDDLPIVLYFLCSSTRNLNLLHLEKNKVPGM